MNRTDWCTISGEVTVAETRLLTREALLELLRADSTAPLVNRLRQNPTYHGLGGHEDPENLSSRIESAVVEALKELANESPQSAPVELLLSAYDHQQVRNFVKARVHKHDFEPTMLSDLAEDQLQLAWDDLVDASPQWAGLCRTVRAELTAGGDPNTVIDLIIDRVELSALLALARTTDCELIEQCYSDYAVLRARLALVRARLAQIDPEQLRRLASGLLPDDELTELIDLAPDRLIAKLTPGHAQEDDTERLTHFAVDIDNRMTACVREARGIVFGPERVFAYAWGLAMECLDLKLISETKLLGAPSEMTEWRLRNTYV